MDHNIDKMLTATAEIAELLLTAKDSGFDFITPRTKELIAELAELAAAMPEHEPEPFVPEPEPEPAPLASESVPEPAPESVTEIEFTEEVSPEKDIVVEEEIQTEVPATPDDSVSVTLPEEEQETIPVPEPQLETDLEPVPEPSPEPSPEPEPAQEPVRPETPTEPRRADLTLWRQLFSINDLFLYRRELFRGSDSLFNDALVRVGDARSLDEVKQMLTDRYGIDMRQPAAKEFVKIISTLF